MASVIVRDEIGVRDALDALGLTYEILHSAVLAGEVARDNCTENHPPGFAGICAHAEATRVLRERLLPLGGARDNDGNLSRTITPIGRIAVTVVTGDGGTGTDYPLKTKYTRGSQTAAAVASNKAQLELFPSLADGGDHDHEGQVSWLIVRRRVGAKLYWELSLPDGFEYVNTDDPNRIRVHIKHWARRIVFDPIELDIESEDADELEVDSEDTIDIEVSRITE